MSEVIRSSRRLGRQHDRQDVAGVDALAPLLLARTRLEVDHERDGIPPGSAALREVDPKAVRDRGSAPKRHDLDGGAGASQRRSTLRHT